jgi:hypothetical protein
VVLQNEPGIKDSHEPFVLAAFARWLRNRYGTLEQLNKVWYQQLRWFEDVQAPEGRAPRVGDFRQSRLVRFRCDHLADQVRWIHSQVDRHHPHALIVNPRV